MSRKSDRPGTAHHYWLMLGLEERRWLFLVGGWILLSSAPQLACSAGGSEEGSGGSNSLTGVTGGSASGGSGQVTAGQLNQGAMPSSGTTNGITGGNGDTAGSSGSNAAGSAGGPPEDPDSLKDRMITVDAGTKVRAIPRAIYGSNMAAWNGLNKPQRSAYAEAMKVVGYPQMRWPGGSWGDEVDWSNLHCRGAWTATTDEALAFLAEFGAQMQPIVNFSGKWCDVQHTPAQAVALAADWVRFMNVTHSYGAKIWEVGNEIYGNWEEGNTDGTTYGTRFVDYYRAMRAVDATIKVGAVGMPLPTDFNGWTKKVLSAVKSKGVTPDFLVIHSYPFTMSATTVPGAALDEKVLAEVDTLEMWTSSLNAMVAEVLGQDRVGVLRYRMTEYAATQGMNDLGGTYLEAMYDAQVLLELARLGWDGANKWDQRSGLDDDYETVPHYYTYYMLSRRFGADMVNAASKKKTVRAYAAKDGSGNLTLFLVNNSATESVAATVGVTGFSPAAAAKKWVMLPAGNAPAGAPREAVGLEMNGVVNPAPSSLSMLEGAAQPGSSAFSVDLPPNAMVFVSLPPAP